MEGLPLAIELTAARSARLGAENVLAHLRRRLDVVTSAPRDLPDHQQTLRAAIAWSYDLLGKPERLLFIRMSVFAGGATLDALEAVCNAREDIEGDC
jgi:predicted ATPase